MSFESISEGRLLGKVDCEPKVIGRSSMDAAAEGGRAKVYGTELMDINVDSVQKGIHFFVVMAKYMIINA